MDGQGKTGMGKETERGIYMETFICVCNPSTQMYMHRCTHS